MARDVSNLSMLSEPHNRGTDKFTYTCNSCKSHVEIRYHCIVCDNFDLCVPCHEKEGHPHRMMKLNLDIDMSDLKQRTPQEAHKLLIQRCIQSLVHACQCGDANCQLPTCQKMKCVLTHTKICKWETKADCPICKQLITLCSYHSKHCQETNCSVPFCSSINQNREQVPVLQMRMAAMCIASPLALPTPASSLTSPTPASPSSSPTLASTLTSPTPASPSSTPTPASSLTSPKPASPSFSPTLASPSASPTPASPSALPTRPPRP